MNKQNAVAALSDEDLIAILYNCTAPESEARAALTYEQWKDGIEIDVPTTVFRKIMQAAVDQHVESLRQGEAVFDTIDPLPSHRQVDKSHPLVTGTTREGWRPSSEITEPGWYWLIDPEFNGMEVKQVGIRPGHKYLAITTTTVYGGTDFIAIAKLPDCKWFGPLPEPPTDLDEARRTTSPGDQDLSEDNAAKISAGLADAATLARMNTEIRRQVAQQECEHDD